MRTLIVISLVIYCIPSLGNSDELKLYKFDAGTLIKADDFNKNFEAIEKKINNIEDAKGKEVNELKQLIRKVRSDLNEAIKPCPDHNNFSKFGFCIWHIAGYDKTYVQAASACRNLGGRLCTLAEVSAAQAAGAEWCSWGWVADWVSDQDGKVAYPMQTPRSGCGISYLQIANHPKNRNFGANCCF